MKEVNICYMKVADTGKWKWFLADEYGRAFVHNHTEHDSIEAAIIHADKNYEAYKSRIQLASA